MEFLYLCGCVGVSVGELCQCIYFNLRYERLPLLEQKLATAHCSPASSAKHGRNCRGWPSKPQRRF